LPIRGKILNIEKTDDTKIYKNTEIQSLITALGLGIKGEDLDESSLRYHRVVIMTDADVDGAHIRTLLLTFFIDIKENWSRKVIYILHVLLSIKLKEVRIINTVITRIN